MKNYRYILPLIVGAMAVFAFSGKSALAASVSGDSVYIKPGEIVDGNLYALGRTVDIDGSVSGDVIVLADNVIINGQVAGDVIVLAGKTDIEGSVGGSVRAAGNSVLINSTVERNADIFASQAVLGGKGAVGWDAAVAADSFENRGQIAGSLEGYVREAKLSGTIGRENRLAVKAPESSRPSWIKNYLLPFAFSLLSFFLVGLVIVLWGKNPAEKIFKNISADPLKALLWGLLAAVIVPLASIVAAFTVIGLPLAAIALAWLLVSVYLAQILAAILGGREIIKRLSGGKINSLVWSLVLGSLIFCLLFSLPYAGSAFRLIAACFGLGGIIAYATDQLRSI